MRQMMSQLSGMPTPVRVVLLLAGGGGIFAALSYARLPWHVLLIGMMLVVLLAVGYRWVLKQLRKRRAAPMEREIRAQSVATPQGISEPARRARLDDLQRNFAAGMERFKAAGKDLYSLPWVLIAGEPGSGKTEAVRHCNVGFPPGLHDEYQGVGGTINMNWWFTNYAVFLDTAGRLMFEEVAAGGSSEWTEFLRMLRTHRPNCPINGMLLVIPADSLIKDTADQIERKAAKIAQQLDVIQRALDVRFPVFLVVTKSDLINGFREFFEDLDDPQAQHQIMGWSNPAPLDEPFAPRLVDQHLATVLDRLRRRRSAQLLDPVHTEDVGARRTDQVDALYAFPQSLDRIVPRLKRYLEMIFVAGEWSAKPLFLRGIYFTSSMREGAALDEELADALGVPVESLPEGKVWERERAYFLRDLFMEKVFPEKGLVTRATNAGRQHRRRKAAILATAIVGVLALLAWTIFGVWSLEKSIGGEEKYWSAAAREQNYRGGYWCPVVVPGAGMKYDYAGDTPIKDIGPGRGRDIVRGRFHDLTLERVRKKIEIPYIFALVATLGSDIEPKRRESARTLYEDGVLRPVVDAARKRMGARLLERPLTTTTTTAATHPAGESARWPAEATAALESLMLLEARAARPAPVQPPAVGMDLGPLFHYVLLDNKGDYAVYAPPPGQEEGQEKKVSQKEALQRPLDWIYSKEGWGADWPPKSLRAGGAQAIQAGVDKFNQYWLARAGRDERLGEIDRLVADLKAYAAKETELVTPPPAVAPGAASTPRRFETVYPQLATLKAGIDKWLPALEGRGLYEARQAMIDEIDRGVGEGYKALLEATAAGGEPAPDSTVAEARKRLQAGLTAITEAMKAGRGGDPAALRAELDALQRECLDPLDPVRLVEAARALPPDIHKRLVDNPRLYAARFEMYALSQAQFNVTEEVPLLAALRGAMDALDGSLSAATEAVGGLTRSQAGEKTAEARAAAALAACSDLLAAARRKRAFAILDGVIKTRLPQDANTYRDYVKAQPEAGAIDRPEVPLALVSERLFEAGYHPDAAAKVLGGFLAVSQVLQKENVDNPDALKAVYAARHRAYIDYVTGYVAYWTGQIDLLPDRVTLSSRAEFIKAVQATQGFDLMLGLEKLGRAVLDALTKVSPFATVKTVCQDVRIPVDDKRVRKGLENLAIKVFRAACADMLDAWKTLPNELDKARLSACERPQKYAQRLGDCYVSDYLKDLGVIGLKLLADEYQGQMAKNLAEFTKECFRFPLNVPEAGRGDLSAKDVAKARRLLGGFGAVGFVPAGDADIDKQLKGLEKPDFKDPADWELMKWCRAVLEALPAEDQSYGCTVSISDRKQEPETLERWRYLRLDQGGAKVGDKNTDTGMVELGKVSYPGEAVALAFRKSDTDAPDVTIRFAGHWGVLRMLHEAKVLDRSKDGRTWELELTVRKEAAKALVFRVQLKFDPEAKAGLPAIKDWPGQATP